MPALSQRVIPQLKPARFVNPLLALLDVQPDEDAGVPAENLFVGWVSWSALPFGNTSPPRPACGGPTRACCGASPWGRVLSLKIGATLRF
jgi:hypothetical protein